jgi:hypothetical protein
VSKKARKAQREAARRAAQGLPVGDMLTRMANLAKGDARPYSHNVNTGWYRQNGEIVYDPNLDSRRNSQGGHMFHSSAKQDDETFTCASTDVEGKCPIMQVPEVHVPYEMWDTFIELADACETEWLALLKGEFNTERNVYEVKDFYFPPQTATGTSVSVADGPRAPAPQAGTIGAIHSHCKMGAFWSSTDKAHSNWPLEIVINAKGEYAALVRFQLKCGSYTKQDAKVMLLGQRPEPPDPPFWAELSAAFAQGAKLTRTKGRAREDDPEEPEETGGQRPLALVSEQPLTQIVSEQPMSEQVPDDSSAAHEAPLDQTEECPKCQGVGLVELIDSAMAAMYGVGDVEPDICGKCNGWGRLMNGKPISAQAPADLRVQ